MHEEEMLQHRGLDPVVSTCEQFVNSPPFPQIVPAQVDGDSRPKAFIHGDGGRKVLHGGEDRTYGLKLARPLPRYRKRSIGKHVCRLAEDLVGSHSFPQQCDKRGIRLFGKTGEKVIRRPLDGL